MKISAFRFALCLLLAAIPSEAAPSSRTVFLVQDPLLEEVGQKKASTDLEELLKKEGVRLIFVPGADGEVTFSHFKERFPTAVRKKTADEYLAKGRLTTAEYLDLTSELPLKIWGVDEPGLYGHQLELTKRLLRRSSAFERLQKKTFRNAREELSYQHTRRIWDEFSQVSETRQRFIGRNLARVMLAHGEEKVVLLTAGAQLDILESELEEHYIICERVPFRSSVLLEEERLERRLLEEGGASVPPVYLPNAWKSDFFKNAFLALRPAREALAFELMRDRRPLLWDLGTSLGVSPEQNFQMLLNGLNAASADTLKQSESRVRFSWARGLFPEESAVEGAQAGLGLWQQQVLRQIESDYDKQKYEAFKEMVRKMELGKSAGGESVESHVLGYIDAYERALLTAEKSREEKRRGLSDIPWVARLLARVRNFMQGIPSAYAVKTHELQGVMKFLRNNQTAGGMPLSYKAPRGYWTTVESSMDEVDSAMERLLVEQCVSISDAARWQIVLSFYGTERDAEHALAHTRRLLSGSSGELKDIRACTPFRYGDEKKTIDKQNAYFFRIIADQYIQEDPLGYKDIEGFPNFSMPHHEDWKPITGEQAWGAIIGPLQSAYHRHGGTVPPDSEELTLALSILPALEAMRAPNGALYHVPEGTHGKSPHDISNENNSSMFSALKMLRSVLKDGHAAEAERVEKLSQGIEEYFKREGFDRREGIFYQGGFYMNGRFYPARVFAADCQTWGINALGPKWIDATFGHGTSYRVWSRTKERAGYLDPKGALRGIGFSDGHDVMSVEWTCGAILTARLLAEFYAKTEPRWAEEAKRDAVSMRYGIEDFKVPNPDGSIAYLYSNRRYFIPWGWWANPIASMASSAWVVLTDMEFNPFILGGRQKKAS